MNETSSDHLVQLLGDCPDGIIFLILWAETYLLYKLTIVVPNGLVMLKESCEYESELSYT